MVEVAAATLADDDRGGGAGDAGHVVVLGEPEAAVAPGLGVPREIEGVASASATVAPSGTGERSRTEKAVMPAI